MHRDPAVAGQFYPGDQVALRSMLSDFCPQRQEQMTVCGIMVPHAGYIYSGAIAGAVYDRVVIPDRVILLGPNHHGHGHAGAVFADGSWTTPLGDIRIDAELAGRLLAAAPDLAADERAHRFEHSLEVQVPFIQYLNPQARLLPICIGSQRLEPLLRIGAAIADTIMKTPEPVLIVASTDMTHFESAESAAAKDRLALACVATLDATGLYRTVVEHRISMCGFMPTVVLLEAARLLGAGRGEVAVYGNSGDVTHDFSDVVAYASAWVGCG